MKRRFNMSMDTDPQQQEAASSLVFVVRSSLRQISPCAKLFVDTIKYALMGRTKAQAEHQESRA